MKKKEVEVKKPRKKRVPKVKEVKLTPEKEVIKPRKEEELKEVELEKIKVEPIPEQVKVPVTYAEHIAAGFITPGQSEQVQKQGKRVVEIKNIEGLTLHRLEKI